MSFTSHFIKLYRENIIASSIRHSDTPIPTSVLFLNDFSHFQPDTVFIATSDLNLLNSETADIRATILIAVNQKTSGDYIFPANFNVIVTSFELTELFNHVSQMITAANQWKTKCDHIVLEGKGIQDIINQGAIDSGKTILLINDDLRITHISNEKFDSGLDNALKYGLIPDQIANRINLNSAQTATEFIRLTINNESYILRSLVKDSRLLGYLIFVDSLAPVVDLETLSFYMSEAILKILNLNHAANYSTNPVFSQIFEDIYEMKLTHRDTILNKLDHLPFSVSTYFECIVIKFKNSAHNLLPMNYIVNQLQCVFPKQNITSFNNEIIILYSYLERDSGFDFDEVRLNQILERYDGYAAVSQGSRKWDWLRTFYILARKTLDIGILFRINPQQRLFSFEEFSMYTIIDMCANYFYKVHNHKNLIHLIPPEIVQLYRYDLQNNSDLRDVLYNYLINNHNIVKTAKIMHMHRNTIQNKISKIKDLIDVDLEDGRVQERLMFSYQVLKYHETFNDMDL